MNNIKFAVIKLTFSVGDLEQGSNYNALLFGEKAVVICNNVPMVMFPEHFLLVKEVQEKEDDAAKEITGAVSLMGKKLKSAHFEFTE